jgi:hypothetical protein
MNLRILALVLLLDSTAIAVAETFDFDGAAVGSTPRDWLVAQTGDGEPPNWQIVDDPASETTGNVLAHLAPDRRFRRYPLAIYAGADLADGRVAVRFKPVSGGAARAAGLVWRYQDRNNYYAARADALRENVVLFKVEDGRRRDLGFFGKRAHDDELSRELAISASRWSTLEVYFSGSRFSVLFDGAKLIDVDDSSFSQPGKIGLWTMADSVSYFDDFEFSEK